MENVFLLSLSGHLSPSMSLNNSFKTVKLIKLGFGQLVEQNSIFKDHGLWEVVMD